MNSKRKVNGSAAASDELDDRSAKRTKFPSSNNDTSRKETPQSTTEKGLQFLETIRKVQDKSGRQIALQFLELPKRNVPGYYNVTKLPISISTIEAKLRQQEFSTLAELEGYFRRMVQNAKDYNVKGSEIHEDAEKLRKASSNWMVKHNPAYKDKGYTPIMTPLPEDEQPEEAAQSKRTIRGGRQTKEPKAPGSRKSGTPAASGLQYDGVSFAGLTFQQAQEKIVEDMIHYKEDPDDEITAFENFIQIPDRSLYPEYYTVILNPVSLTTLWNHVKGIRSKKDITGMSDFNSWASFEEEAAITWKNACHYNEDGSEIYEQAKQMEVFFNKKLAEAKKVVPEPVQTKIKLKMPDLAQAVPQQKITLKIAAKASPAGTPTPTNGHSSATNGTGRRNPFGGATAAAIPSPNLEQLERARSMSGSIASPVISPALAVKPEDTSRNSPAVIGGQSRAGSQPTVTPAAGNGMPPPLNPGIPVTHLQGGHPQSFSHQPQYQAPPPAADPKWRQPGKNASDALITNLHLATHPGLHLPQHLRMDIPPSDTMAQQSITINLPSTHYYVQFRPKLAASLSERQYKLFATIGGKRLHYAAHGDSRNPLFEARLNPGINRIEVELIAALPKGVKPTNGVDMELEKITVFANLLKAA